MTKDTHTDNDELKNRVTEIIWDFEDDYRPGESFNRDQHAETVVEQIMQLIAPTKSSGELEEILTLFQTRTFSLTRQSSYHAYNLKEAKEAIEALHTTQTTKLQAEARLDELGSLIPNFDGVGNIGYQYTDGSRVSLDVRINQLEREHKIGEDDARR